MISSVLSFLRLGSTELADTVLAGFAADQFVLAESGLALAITSFACATRSPFRSTHGYRSVVEPTGLMVEATPPEHLLAYAPQGITSELSRILEPGQRFFDAQAYGSWFEYALPGKPIAFDSRIEVIPLSEWTLYDDVSNGREGWQQILDYWGVTVAVLSPQQQEGLIPRILADPGWQLVYRDPDGLIFRRRPSA